MADALDDGPDFWDSLGDPPTPPQNFHDALRECNEDDFLPMAEEDYEETSEDGDAEDTVPAEPPPRPTRKRAAPDRYVPEDFDDDGDDEGDDVGSDSDAGSGTEQVKRKKPRKITATELREQDEAKDAEIQALREQVQQLNARMEGMKGGQEFYKLCEERGVDPARYIGVGDGCFICDYQTNLVGGTRKQYAKEQLLFGRTYEDNYRMSDVPLAKILADVWNQSMAYMETKDKKKLPTVTVDQVLEHFTHFTDLRRVCLADIRMTDMLKTRAQERLTAMSHTMSSKEYKISTDILYKMSNALINSIRELERAESTYRRLANDEQYVLLGSTLRQRQIKLESEGKGGT